jgi:hypothetical protein
LAQADSSPAEVFPDFARMDVLARQRPLHQRPEEVIESEMIEQLGQAPVLVDEGNHFRAWQEPDLFTTEVRAAFRSLR